MAASKMPKSPSSGAGTSWIQVGDALAAREAQPDSPRAPGSHTGRLRHVGFWGGGDKQRPPSSKVGVAHAECLNGTWVNALSRGVASDAH